MKISHLYSLKELIEALNNKAHSVTYLTVLEKIRFKFRELENLCFWDADNYSKINIGTGNGFELVLICWEDNQQSTIHQHDFSEAFTYILKGELTEKIYKPLNDNGKYNLDGISILSPKSISSLQKNSDNFHQLSNKYKGRTVSLHLYVK